MNPTPNQPADALREAIKRAIEDRIKFDLPDESLDAILQALHASGLVEKGNAHLFTFETVDGHREYKPTEEAEELFRAFCQRSRISCNVAENMPMQREAFMAGLLESSLAAPAKVDEARADWPNDNGRMVDAAGNAIENPAPPDGAKETADRNAPIVLNDKQALAIAGNTIKRLNEELGLKANILLGVSGSLTAAQEKLSALELQRNALRREVASFCHDYRKKCDEETKRLAVALAKTQEALTTLRESYGVSCDHRASLSLQLAQSQRERDEAKERHSEEYEKLHSDLQLNLEYLRLRQLKEEELTARNTAATQELEGLRADRERLDWLDANVTVAAKYQCKPPASDHTGPVYWSFNWSQWHNNDQNSLTLRSAIDAARTKETPRHETH